MDDYFGLIFRAMKSDKNVTRVVAFIRRLLQMSLINEANFTAATLLVISEIFSTRADVRFEIYQSKIGDKKENPVISTQAVNASDDDDEKFLDVDRVKEEKNKNQN